MKITSHYTLVENAFIIKSVRAFLVLLLFWGSSAYSEMSLSVNQKADEISDLFCNINPINKNFQVEISSNIISMKELIENLNSMPNHYEATQEFCAILIRGGEQCYSNFIKRLLGALRWNEKPKFLICQGHSEKSDCEHEYLNCLEHYSTTASPAVAYMLFNLETNHFSAPPPSSYRWLLIAAEGGDDIAQLALAEKILEFSGDPTRQQPNLLKDIVNKESYKNLLLLASQNNNRKAQKKLAEFYQARSVRGSAIPVGWEVLPDSDGAFYWLSILANQSDNKELSDDANEMLGVINFEGKLIKQDYINALIYFEKIPVENIHRHCGAVFYLSQIYKNGLGVASNLEKYAYYFNIFNKSCIKI